SSVIGVWYL
nr:Chain C, H13b peptide [Mus musculus]